jgi:hypothetical protein
MTTMESHPYQRGIFYATMPIPPIPEHCITVDAGPVAFVVESRLLTNEILRTQHSAGSLDLSAAVYDDFGATVHVCDASDGVEHLRFDCFEKEPHYHYIKNSEKGNLICRIDEVAEGDPIEWTLGRLRQRLPEMLELAGAQQVARAVQDRSELVTPAIDRVDELLRRAQIEAARMRVQGG